MDAEPPRDDAERRFGPTIAPETLLRLTALGKCAITELLRCPGKDEPAEPSGP